MLNTGWRRPTIKGGSIWVEASARAELYNNLMANCRFGIKRDVKKPEDSRSKASNSLYYSYSQEGATQFQPSTEILTGTNDIISNKAGDNDPKFVNYPVSTSQSNADFSTTWDFHLATGSPALNKGITTFSRNFKEGLSINGQTYKSPEPASYIGAFGAK